MGFPTLLHTGRLFFFAKFITYRDAFHTSSRAPRSARDAFDAAFASFEAVRAARTVVTAT